MVKIVRAAPNDHKLLSKLAAQTLLESHAASPAAAGLQDYVKKYYNPTALEEELTGEENIFHIIYYKGSPAGYSKIIPDFPYKESRINNITKLERLYLLKEFYNLNLGQALLNFIIELAKTHKQEGIWLYTWNGNERAIRFYQKNGFSIIGSHDFMITGSLSNPNHQMLLKF